MSDDDKKVIEEAVKEAKEHENAEDKDELDKALKELNDKIMPIGAKIYEAAGKEAGPEEPKAEDGGNKPDGDGPIEGEVVNDKKN